MLLKWLITFGILFFLYRTFFAGPSLGSGKRPPSRVDDHSNSSNNDSTDEGEYIDYEEVD